jgi:hypothetical protein
MLLAQKKDADKLEQRWSDLRKSHGYGRTKNYEGPQTNDYVYPTDIQQNTAVPQGSANSTTTPYRGLPYSPQQIQRARQIPSNPGGGSGGTGTVRRDPSIAPPEPIDPPDAPDYNGPDFDSPDVDITGSFWTYLLIILGLIVVALVVLQLLRNRKPSDSKVSFDPLDEDMNPAAIPKTELELRLEAAENEENYRECVRIWFLFAMKELIEKRLIFWKPEKTNIHYIIEMQGKPTSAGFENIVSLYELVWYGDYIIDKRAYQSMLPALEDYYKQAQAIR